MFIKQKILLILLSSLGIQDFAIGIANDAAYYIKNVQDGLCVEGGPIVDKDSAAVFQSGIATSVNCSASLDQQWILTQKGMDDHRPMFEFRLQNTKAYNKKLNAVVRGEFIKYFDSFVEIRQTHQNHTVNSTTITNGTKTVKTVTEPSYHLYVKKFNKCFESMGENHVLHLVDCDPKFESLSQQWILTIVNQEVAAGTICTSFWSCNYS